MLLVRRLAGTGGRSDVRGSGSAASSDIDAAAVVAAGEAPAYDHRIQS
ncbi:hypothetical protein [Microbispora triticiradicis]|nr:hypothetical protein [Microbispora triticiradicis]MBO4269793.1 hypothetical protein [Microbispora triticiradicis]